MNLIRLYLLDSFRIERDSKTIHLPTRKVESLLAYLALFPGQHSCEQLAALLWGDSTDEQARHSLRTALAAISKALDDALIADRESVQLNPDMNFWIDVKEIEGLEIRDSSNLQSLISNYHDLLPNFYDEWIVRERERLRAIYLDALLQLAQHNRSSSDYARAIETAQRVLAADRANEKAHQHLMFCFAVQGDRIAALKQYDEYTKILREDLNTPPSSETTALRDQIMQELTGAPSREAAMTNLPNPLTSFIGREKEIRTLKELLATTRLLTLSGAGGCGKTRLAIEIASRCARGDDSPNRLYKNGVWWVDLSTLSEPSLVPQSVANVFDLQETPDTPLLKLLANFLREKELLLVLDNCEHLIDASARLAETLLNALPKLQILATSREALNVTGETVWHVPSLAVPNAEHLPPLNQLTQYDAIKLFVQCAAAIAPNWKLDGNARAVTQICARLDGVPLAIELAAARLKTLSAEQIAERLNDRFHLLTSGSRTALPRQQTLRAAIDWSFDLLSEPERVLLSRLSVFAGGWTFDAAECVWADSVPASKGRMKGDDILDLLSHLIDKSLILAEEHDSVTRYRMLETIRQYANEKLLESGESERVRDRHLEYFLKLVEETELKLRGATHLTWLNHLETEHDNLRAALDWSQESERGAEWGLQLAATLSRFWDLRGYLREGRERISSALAHSQHLGRTVARGKAFCGGAELAYRQSDYLVARPLANEALAIYRELSDKQGIADTLSVLGYIGEEEGDYDTPAGLYKETLALNRELENEHGIATALQNLGWVALRLGQNALANSQFEEALAINRRLEDKRKTTFTLSGLAEVAARQGKLEVASRLIEECLALRREIGHKWGIGGSLGMWAWIAMHQRDWDTALIRLRESIGVRKEIGDKGGIAWCLERLAEVAMENNALARAVQIFGAASALRGSMGSVIDPVDQPEHDLRIATLHKKLNEENYSAVWNAGRTMTMEQAIEYALAEQVEVQPSASAQPHDPNALTPREIEVLRLAQAGLSDAKIAEKLVISRRTVNTHLSSIYSKLGVNSRSAATRYALDHKLI
ncbi:MAG: tetratricopeptide repeat protein [Chloroflexi bacterium]|nr:tetratricopeptide repeat protein [Chloroflexota bacterium]